MTETQQMQQPSENIDTMFHADSGAGPPASTNNIDTQRLDPHTSLDEYNRTMLEYTQRRMLSFVDLDDMKSHSSGSSSRSSQSSSRSSQSSGNSGTSGIVRQANGPPPTSASAAAAARGSRQQPLRAARSPNEAKPSRY